MGRVRCRSRMCMKQGRERLQMCCKEREARIKGNTKIANSKAIERISEGMLSRDPVVCKGSDTSPYRSPKIGLFKSLIKPKTHKSQLKYLTPLSINNYC